MAHIAILAFGSLIEDPGKEIRPRIRECIEGVETPFVSVWRDRPCGETVWSRSLWRGS